ncbi:16551_t:CDS:2 [Funneliformis caledonium]|uniref:16551_t:CDS:1 n=1 Tax=Funneliformis caledonium TaxID=1117310 RepID=A0A9N9IQX2_9GLOM|nr:16551_t:CDS:2 [Funneliformis caledonium]
MLSETRKVKQKAVNSDTETNGGGPTGFNNKSNEFHSTKNVAKKVVSSINQMSVCCLNNFNNNIRKSDLKPRQVALHRSSRTKNARSNDNEIEKEDFVKSPVKKQRYNKKKDIAA